MPLIFHEIVFRRDILRIPGAETTIPGARYYATPPHIAALGRTQRSAGVALFDDHGPTNAFRFWRGESLNGKTVAYYHEGAFGDELIHTTFYREIVLRHPAARLSAAVKFRGGNILIGNRFIGDYPLPIAPVISHDWAGAFDYWIAPRSVIAEARAGDGEAAGAYDLLEAEIGVQLSVKRPYIYMPSDVRANLRARAAQACLNANRLPEDFWKRFVLIHTNASEPERTPDDWHDRIRACIKVTRGRFYYAAVGDAEHIAAIPRSDRDPLPVFLFAQGTPKSPPVELLLAFAEAAAAVICPDSMIMHAAAAFDTPAIALWNMMPGARTEDGLRIPAPAERIATYANTRAVSMTADHEEVAEMLGQIVGKP